MTESLTGSPRPGHSTLRGSPFPPIAEYGFLAQINAVMHLIDADERLSTAGPPATGLEAGAGAAAEAGS